LLFSPTFNSRLFPKIQIKKIGKFALNKAKILLSIIYISQCLPSKKKLQFQNKLQYPNSNDQNSKLVLKIGILNLDLAFSTIWNFVTLSLWHFLLFGFGISHYLVFWYFGILAFSTIWNFVTLSLWHFLLFGFWIRNLGFYQFCLL